jgi:type II secretory pathway predicted ATPase ExeA
VLFGQPELDQHLELASMRQLKERITHSFHVPALQADLTGDFLAFRLRAAGHEGPALFSPAAARLIADASQGIAAASISWPTRRCWPRLPTMPTPWTPATPARPSPSRRSAAGVLAAAKAAVIAGAAV